MGMSASQARLIALTERMNDIEYQGQQINQQRTTLSNQVNSLYNSLLDMDVPTPPSTQDYTKVVYSGILGASAFDLGTVRPTGSNKYSIDLNYKMAGESITYTNKTRKIIDNTATLKYSEISTEAAEKIYDTKTTTKVTSGNSIANQEAASDKDVLIQTTKGAMDNSNDSYGALKCYDADGNEISDITKLADDAVVYVAIKGSNIDKFSTDDTDIVKKDVDGNYTNVFEQKVDKETTYELKTEYKGTTADKKVENMNFYTATSIGENVIPQKIKTVAELEKAIKDGRVFRQTSNGEVEFKNESYDEGSARYLIRVDGDSVPLQQLCSEGGQDILAECGVSLSSVVAGLRHSFNIPENTPDSDVLALFSVYSTKSTAGELTPYFVRNADTSTLTDNNKNVKTYAFDPSGTYVHSVAKDDCQLEYDSDGRITKIGICNEYGDYDWVELTIKSETDNEAYNEAFKEYEYDKYKYDKAQQEINIQTSIIQAEDKNLELKLTRLDNERTAVNTEIEAVKKVVDDNIQKSFKTFSG